ncbi:MAG: hypothetical protein ACTJHM_03755 [Agrococcus casei]|uniref:hypothetical protein n=1 Tax=Agrococcus casei TaxID=343512 RepID=UPI003F93D725
MPEMTEEDSAYSTNDHAERVMGRRIINGPVGVILFAPVELGYSCPIHKQSIEHSAETLHWSEYNSFLWCELCDRDYPSALCATDLDHAITVYLNSVESASKRRSRQRIEEPRSS